MKTSFSLQKMAGNRKRVPLSFEMRHKPAKMSLMRNVSPRTKINAFGMSSMPNKRNKSPRHMNYTMAKRRYPKMHPLGDADGDGWLNAFDCRPLNKNKDSYMLRQEIEKRLNLVHRKDSVEMHNSRLTRKERIKSEHRERDRLKRQGYTMVGKKQIVSFFEKNPDMIKQASKLARGIKTKRRLDSAKGHYEWYISPSMMETVRDAKTGRRKAVYPKEVKQKAVENDQIGLQQTIRIDDGKKEGKGFAHTIWHELGHHEAALTGKLETQVRTQDFERDIRAKDYFAGSAEKYAEEFAEKKGARKASKEIGAAPQLLNTLDGNFTPAEEKKAPAPKVGPSVPISSSGPIEVNINKPEEKFAPPVSLGGQGRDHWSSVMAREQAQRQAAAEAAKKAAEAKAAYEKSPKAKAIKVAKRVGKEYDKVSRAVSKFGSKAQKNIGKSHDKWAKKKFEQKKVLRKGPGSVLDLRRKYEREIPVEQHGFKEDQISHTTVLGQ